MICITLDRCLDNVDTKNVIGYASSKEGPVTELVKVAEKVNGETPMDISSKINLENIPLPIQSNISWQLPA